MAHPPPPKKEVVLALLERATVFVHLDPRRPGAIVPPHLRQRPQLVLQIGLNMAVPIPDLQVDDDGIRCTLSFSGRPTLCVMPWACIYAMVGEDGRGVVWPDDLPKEVAHEPTAMRKPSRKDDLLKAEKTGEKKALGRAKRDAPVSSLPEAKVKRPRRKVNDAPPETADIRKRIVAVPHPKERIDEVPPLSEPRPETPPPPAQRKPKRELPPYLRVVK